MRKILFAVALVALTSCTTIQDTADALSAFEGRPLQELIDRLGYPDKQETVVDAIAYYWGTSGMESENAAVCQIKAVAGEDRIIRVTSVYGNIAGCEQTIKGLR